MFQCHSIMAQRQNGTAAVEADAEFIDEFIVKEATFKIILLRQHLCMLCTWVHGTANDSLVRFTLTKQSNEEKS